MYLEKSPFKTELNSENMLSKILFCNLFNNVSQCLKIWKHRAEGIILIKRSICKYFHIGIFYFKQDKHVSIHNILLCLSPLHISLRNDI